MLKALIELAKTIKSLKPSQCITLVIVVVVPFATVMIHVV